MAQVTNITAILLDQLDSCYHGKAWHGPHLRGVLHGLDEAEAGRKGPAAAHSIAEIALHCAYWKYAVRRRLLKSKRGLFPWKGSNWLKVPEPLTKASWLQILDTLEQEHAALSEAVKAFPEKQWGSISVGSKYRNYQLIQGIAAHDVYHAGQVRLLKPKRGD